MKREHDSFLQVDYCPRDEMSRGSNIGVVTARHPVPAIEIRGLATGYTARHSVKTVSRDLDATLEPGELTCLLGPNGAGKSTLLKTLGGFIPPLAGEFRIMGRPAESYSPRQLSQTVGVVLTEKVQLPNMTVRELAAMGRSPYTGFWGRLGSDDCYIVDRALDMAGVGALADRRVGSLSDGERQKVMIAKALAQSTPVILLDEPSAFLDYPSKVDLMMLLRRLAAELDRGILLSTHDLELALRLADRIWLIDKDRGFETGSPEEMAVTGSLERFFSRPGIEFDRRAVMFRPVPDICSSVMLKGGGETFAMVVRALERNGIATRRDPDGVRHVIEVGESLDDICVDGQRVDGGLDGLVRMLCSESAAR